MTFPKRIRLNNIKIDKYKPELKINLKLRIFSGGFSKKNPPESGKNPPKQGENPPFSHENPPDPESDPFVSIAAVSRPLISRGCIKDECWTGKCAWTSKIADVAHQWKIVIGVVPVSVDAGYKIADLAD